MLLPMLIGGCTPEQAEHQAEIPLAFVGSGTCQSCHEQEFSRWQNSHHQLAMQSASMETVLGDFSNVTVPYFDTSATFARRDGRFLVTVRNEQGIPTEFEITHTFGVTPLQQYLVDAPGGRKQALQFAWDARPKNAGGQRWYHLYSDEYIAPGDPLHWTGRYFNWNYMCAECHSTDLVQNYDMDSNTFDTTYSEVSVGCEACHGPGSRHVAWANEDNLSASNGLSVDFDDRDGVAWVMNADSGIAERSVANRSRQEPESCGRCHSRRSVLAARYEYGRPLTDTHMPSLLEEDLYHADGRIQGEVYVYGSFVQSKMYAAGVTCSDCHNPHSGNLRAGPDPNDTCSTCHLPARFATVKHSSEQIGDCVSCHMPATTYMGIDDRRDHSFRVPGTEHDPDHYGAIIADGRQGGANSALLDGIGNDTFPPIARATMLSLLEPINDADDRSTLLHQLDDPDSLVRIGALRALRAQVPQVRMQYGSHLLRDEVRAVRIEAARTYVEFRDLLPSMDRRAFNTAAREYRDAMMTALATPDAALNLAEFERRLGNTDAAARHFEHAMRIGDDSPLVHHTYGLHLVRSGKPDEALAHLRRATELDTDVPEFGYVYGVALNSLGQPDEAIAVLTNLRQRFPDHFDIAWALATIYRDAGDRAAARAVAAQLLIRFPGNDRVARLLESLQD